VRTLPRIGLAPGTILVNDTPENLAPLGVDAAPTLNPATAQPAAIASDEHKESLESAGLTTWNPIGFLILCLAAAVRQSAHALMTRDVADGLVGQLGSAFPALRAAADEHVPPDKLAPVLRELLLDGVSVRNLRRILELLIRYETVERANHRTDAVTFVCEGLADLIAFTLARGTSTVVVYLLDPEIENALADGADETTAGRVSAAVRDELAFLPAMAQVPAILTHDESRRRLRDLLRPEFPRMRVLSYSELPPDYNVQPVARISW
jgi:type III secretion protein V